MCVCVYYIRRDTFVLYIKRKCVYVCVSRKNSKNVEGAFLRSPIDGGGSGGNPLIKCILFFPPVSVFSPSFASLRHTIACDAMDEGRRRRRLWISPRAHTRTRSLVVVGTRPSPPCVIGETVVKTETRRRASF